MHGRVVPGSVLFDAAGDPYLADFALAPGDPTLTAGDDVHDFAVMVGACLARDAGPVVEVLARGLATVGRPSMAELVPLLVAAITGERPGRRRLPAEPLQGTAGLRRGRRRRLLRPRRPRRRDRRPGSGDDGPRGRLVLVVGGSGTGKSSVVRAGLLPRVRRGDVPGSQRWFVTTMLPGSSPFKELAECLRRVAVADPSGLADRLAEDEAGVDRVLRRLVPGDGQLLLVVDQLEELFTLASEQDQRAFLDGVMHAVSAPDSRLRVVATLRADFYDRPLAVPAPRDGRERRDGDDDGDAAGRPRSGHRRAGRARRVDGSSGRWWPSSSARWSTSRPRCRRCSTRCTSWPSAVPTKRLELAAYRELGGVGGAIASRAERLYSSLDDGERVAVRRMFERLVVVGAEGEPTRRRAARTELSGLGADRSRRRGDRPVGAGAAADARS